MGTWGLGNFDNDDAADWLYELEQSSDLAFVTSSLEQILRSDEYLEAPTCCNALAAAEIVAALNGKPATDLPDKAKAWVAGKASPPADAVTKAKNALQRVRGESELRELWEESEELDAWAKVLDDLDSRL